MELVKPFRIYDDLSKPPRPERFDQDLDNRLRDFTRDQYVYELITCCLLLAGPFVDVRYVRYLCIGGA